MQNCLYLLATLTVIGIIAGLMAVSHQSPIGGVKERSDKVLKAEFRGIPKDTRLEWDNGKYVPASVPGYESKADYPDSFWVYDEESLNGKVK